MGPGFDSIPDLSNRITINSKNEAIELTDRDIRSDLHSLKLRDRHRKDSKKSIFDFFDLARVQVDNENNSRLCLSCSHFDSSTRKRLKLTFTLTQALKPLRNEEPWHFTDTLSQRTRPNKANNEQKRILKLGAGCLRDRAVPRSRNLPKFHHRSLSVKKKRLEVFQKCSHWP